MNSLVASKEIPRRLYNPIYFRDHKSLQLHSTEPIQSR